MTDLAEFLLARIAEDEAVALRCVDGRPTSRWIVTRDKDHDAEDDRPTFVQLRRPDAEEIGAIGPRWDEDYAVGDGILLTLPWAEDDPRDLYHAARWDPTRVLAECEAKRRIIERIGAEDDGLAPPASLILGDDVLKQLALPYADHPDYRDEWRPE